MNARVAFNIAHYLNGDRRGYRSFGPYWYRIKSLLKQHGHAEALGLGDYYDPRERDWLGDTTDDEAIRQALLLHGELVAAGHVYQDRHPTPDGDVVVINDEDME
jgi:hypothetical protein